MKEFIKKVQRMRELQIKYFKTRDKEILLKSKAAEKEVDSFIDTQTNPGLF